MQGARAFASAASCLVRALLTVDEAGSPKSRVGGPSAEIPAAPSVVSPSFETGSGSSAPAIIAPEQEPGRKGKETPSRLRRTLAVAGGAAILGAVAVLIATSGTSHPPARATAAPMAGALAGREAVIDDAGSDAPPDGSDDADTPHASVWRVASLGSDPGISLVDGIIGKRPLLSALAAAGISYGDAQRVARSLADLRNVDRVGPKETFVVARDKANSEMIAYELSSSPVDVWQARQEPQADGSKRLVARKLDLLPEPVRVRKAVLVGADLRASLDEAGFAPIDDVLTMLDDALDGHAELSDIRPGSRIRIVATQERVDGVFVRWVSLDAVEYFPATPNAPSVRVYRFGEVEGSKKHHGWYDAKGKQPFHGGWRLPVPLARVVSRFNPHRMHPVLHVVMPHNGVDLAAPAGAPVYSTAAGVVTSVGFDGPCGNRVEIEHAHGISSVYCHLSHFAVGLHAGQHVEQRQLIAYVGQTGRVTGPHLHFGIRRGDTFIDPMTLRLDGVRVVPRAERDKFDRLRADLDAELDAIALPAVNNAPAEAPEPETIYEEAP
jgi:murein DD-endopeptidase MepM/ murein hydrolase activator NlpD